MFDICWKMSTFELVTHQKLYILDVLKAWEYARTISRSRKLQIACPKTHMGTKTTYLDIFENHVCMSTMHVCCVYSMYALYVSIIYFICMYYVYVVYVCSTCMYYMFVIMFRFCFCPKVLSFWSCQITIRHEFGGIRR